MKRILSLLLVPFVLFSPVTSSAEEDQEMISSVGCSAIGGLGALATYNAHVALGRIAEAGYSTPDLLKRAAQDAGGIKGGTGAIIKIYGQCESKVPESEKSSIQMLLEMSKLVEQQADALINVLKKSHTGDDTAEAKKKLAKIRAQCAQSIAKNLGFEESLVK